MVFKELATGSIKLTDRVTVSEKAWRTVGSRMFIEIGSQVTVEDLLKGMIIQSGNDATVALAEHVAGSESTFAALMNQHAQDLGLIGTQFVNSSGLPAASSLNNRQPDQNPTLPPNLNHDLKHEHYDRALCHCKTNAGDGQCAP